MRVDRPALGLFGDAKALRKGVRELRIDWGSGYRVYYAIAGRAVVLLLCGGDQRTQRADIGRAVGYWIRKATMKVTMRHDDFMRERLADAEFAAGYLQAALEDGEPAVLLLALRRIAEARGGMAKLARSTGLSREALYRTLSATGNPRLTSLTAILGATGLRLTVIPAERSRRRGKAATPARKQTRHVAAA